MNTPHTVRTLVLCAGAALGFAAHSDAQTLSWNNAAGGNAASATNWSPNQVPGAPNDLVFNLNSTFLVTWNATVAASRSHTLRRGVVTYSLAVPHTIGAGGLRVGDLNTDDAVLTLTTGTLNVEAPVIVADDAGSAGEINVNDDDAELISTAGGIGMTVASNAPGSLNITNGGLVRVSGLFIAGNNAAGTSTVAISGATNTLPFARSTLLVLGTSASRFGQGGDATVTISNGALADFAGDLVIANGSASTSSLTLEGQGGIIPNDATLDVAGDLLLARNTSAGSAAGAATLTANADSQVLVGGTLFVAGDPDGGSATLNINTGALVEAVNLSEGATGTINHNGGILRINGGSYTGHATPLVITGPDIPRLKLSNGLTKTLSPVGGVALVVGDDAGVGTFTGVLDIESGADLIVTGTSADINIGDDAGTHGGIFVLGAGSRLVADQPGDDIRVGFAGSGSISVQDGAQLIANNILVPALSSATGVLVTSGPVAPTITTANLVVGHASGAGSGVVTLNTGTLNATSTGVGVLVRTTGLLTVVSDAILDSDGTILVNGGRLDVGGTVRAATLVDIESGLLETSVNAAGGSRVDAPVIIRAAGEVEVSEANLTMGDAGSTAGVVMELEASVLVGVGRTLALLDADEAVVTGVTLSGGTLTAPNGIEIPNNGTIDGSGAITTPELFYNSGGGVITASGPGIIINGVLRNNSGLIDGTEYTFNIHPATGDGGWTGAGVIDAQVVFNSGTKVNALANMTMGDGSNFGVTFNLGSELHASTRTVTLLDGNGLGLPSVTDFTGGHVVCAQPLVVNNGRRLSGRGGSVDTPLLTIHGRLSPGEVVEILGETGEMTINGDLTLGANADFDVEIGGPLIPIEFDRVLVDGDVVLNGAINLSLIRNFNPPPGSRFIIMTYDSVAGAFSSQNLPPGWQIIVRPRVMEAVNGCPADFNHDGFVNSQDFFDYTVAFFSADHEQGGPADFNLDGFVNSQDFFDFLIAFFNGC